MYNFFYSIIMGGMFSNYKLIFQYFFEKIKIFYFSIDWVPKLIQRHVLGFLKKKKTEKEIIHRNFSLCLCHCLHFLGVFWPDDEDDPPPPSPSLNLFLLLQKKNQRKYIVIFFLAFVLPSAKTQIGFFVIFSFFVLWGSVRMSYRKSIAWR